MKCKNFKNGSLEGLIGLTSTARLTSRKETQNRKVKNNKTEVVGSRCLLNLLGCLLGYRFH